MSDFWTRKNLPQPTQPSAEEAQAVEETVAQSMEEMEAEQVQLVDEEGDEDDLSAVLNNANLRLEQGRLYQMIIEQPLFGQTDADPNSIRIVEREIRRHARERMEFMLGMRHESARNETVVSSPFNELEVVALKTIAAQMSKGATKSVPSAPLTAPAPVKKDSFTPISGSTKLKNKAPVETKEFKPLPSSRTAPVAKKEPTPKAAVPAQKSPISKEDDDGFLDKPIDKMTPDELLAYDQASITRRNKLKAAIPANMAPMPSAQELEGLYLTRQANMVASASNPAMALVKLLGNK